MGCSPAIQGIVPTMILVLAGLELTSSDVHSRISKLSHPVFRPGISVTVSDSDDSYDRRTGILVSTTAGRRESYAAYPLEQMRFASSTTTRSDNTGTFKSDKSEYHSSRQFGHGMSISSVRSVQSTNGDSDIEYVKPPSSKV